MPQQIKNGNPNIHSMGEDEDLEIMDISHEDQGVALRILQPQSTFSTDMTRNGFTDKAYSHIVNSVHISPAKRTADQSFAKSYSTKSLLANAERSYSTKSQITYTNKMIIPPILKNKA
jgi:hypothetical protein